MIGLGGNDTLDGGDGNDVFLSGLGDDSILGGAGDDVLFAFAGQANGYNIFGIPGVMTLSGGSDIAQGGDGVDKIIVNGQPSEFELTRLSQSDYLIRSKADASESLRFSGFERISFGRLTFEDLPQDDQTVVYLDTLPISSDPLARASFWKGGNVAVNSAKMDAAVGLNDAIGILKMIVGLNVNSGVTPLSPYQSIAADFNRSGAVDLNDAIEVLKHVVGLPSSDPAWSCYDDSKIPQTLSDSQGLAPGAWSAAAKLSDLSAVPAEVKVIGVLTGDVDGSWAPA